MRRPHLVLSGKHHWPSLIISSRLALEHLDETVTANSFCQVGGHTGCNLLIFISYFFLGSFPPFVPMKHEKSYSRIKFYSLNIICERR